MTVVVKRPRTTDQRQARQIARQVARDADRLRRAWEAYTDKLEALAGIAECTSVWPSSVADVAPVVCQKLEGHDPGDDDGGHRHRILGSQVVVTW